MARKHKPEEHENHERWLVSYADFITLLFAFFVVMYSVSSVNEGKMRIAAQSLLEALNPVISMSASKIHIQPKDMSGPTSSRDITLDMQVSRKLYESVKAIYDLDKTGRARQVLVVTQDERGIIVSIADSLAFAPGKADLLPEAVEPLLKVAAVLKESSQQIRVEGHTDNVPIHSAQFPSNWELSGVRALNIVRFLGDGGHLPPERLSAGGFGEFHPVASNDTEEGRAKNRRVEIIVVKEPKPPDGKKT
jgi:chemotaxis protein MotB